MSPLTSTYLLPAILLNPAFILHLINTFVSHIRPPPPTFSVSPHPFMESLGPVPGSTPYMDMHGDGQLCWSYTAIMVVVQMLAIGRVQDNRGRRRELRAAAKAEKERTRKEKINRMEAERQACLAKEETLGNGSAKGLDGTFESPLTHLSSGAAYEGNGKLLTGDLEDEIRETESETSLTETSEEEMMV